MGPNTSRTLELLRHLSEGVLVLDRSMRIRSASRKVEHVTGWRPRDLLGTRCHEVLQTNRCEQGCLAREAIRTGHTFLNVPVEVRVKGSLHWIDTCVLPLKDVREEIVGAEILFSDYEELSWGIHQAGVARSSARYQELHERLIELIQDGILVVDDAWEIVEFNRGAERITGYRREDVLGKRCSDVFQTSLCERGCPLKKALYLEEPIRDVEVRIRHSEGRALSVLVNLAPLKDAEGCVVGGMQTLRDVSGLEWMRQELVRSCDFSNMVGKSAAVQGVYRRLEDVARTDTTVLILGESGTGKELVARAIHFNGDRRDRPFVGVNCSALPEGILESELFGHVRGAFTGAIRDKAGRFELADGGTLFLDEVGELSPSMQVKLLRVLEAHEFQRVGDTRTIRVDIRLVAATNKDLRREVTEGRFREDLYYRLNVFPIELPPLRERTEDLPLLVHHYMERFNHQMGRRVRGISGEALDALYTYSWPGNVRELENAIEHAFVHSHGVLIQMEDLPGHIAHADLPGERKSPGVREEALESLERQLILRHLNEARWRRQAAARRLGISPVTLWRKMKKYGIREERTMEG